MKISKIIICIIILTLSFSSCTDWINETPSSQMTSDELMQNELGVREALIGVYLKLASENLYGKNMTWHFIDKLAMPYVVTSNVGAQSAYILRHRYETEYIKTNFIDVIWGQAYTTIASINNIIETIEQNPNILNPKSKNLIMGELLGLRAMLHLDIMRLYGYGNLKNIHGSQSKLTIPYVKKYSKELTPQLTYKETFELLINDLNEAINYLNDDPIRKQHQTEYYSDINYDGFWDNRNKRMNYYAVKALLARTYMWEGNDINIEKAFQIAKELIALENNIYTWVAASAINSSELSKIDRTFSSEHLFSLDVYGLVNIFNPHMTDPANDTGNTTVYINESDFTGNIFDYLIYGKNGKVYAPNHPNADENGLINISDIGDTDPLPNIGAGDYRGEIHFAYSSSPMKGQVYYLRKFYQPSSYSDLYKNRIPLIKITELYYIVAEYYLLKGNKEKAINAIDKVRFQRGLSKKIDPKLIISVQAELNKEYIREFAGEGQLFFYYKRLNIKDPTYYSQSGGYTGIEEYSFRDEDFLLPYPDDEVLYGNREQQ